jgi:DNA (cytosine-5)-methyltransferase 1
VRELNGATYNEIDPFAADWLERLIDAGHIAPGIVYRRSIAALAHHDVAGPGQRHFFAGIGVWSYALRLAGVPDDADIWTGSCPCQPFSDAGTRSGTSDPRHLWPTWFALIEQCRPPVIFGEQVASRDGLAWLDLVYADLERCGYAVGASDLCAASVGAPHRRQRLYFVAYTDEAGRVIKRGTRLRTDEFASRGNDADRCGETRIVGDAARPRLQGCIDANTPGERRYGPADAGSPRDPWIPCEWVWHTDGRWRPVEPGTFPLAHGATARVGRLRGYGNAIVSEVAATFIEAALDAIAERIGVK